ncbi:hypothetical protein EZS27_004115 [termite gut metagenome]|uniref:Uncharacterized protein n=1 Tax=termite gut metagenome TaxID=433724 RepID=A0A5J4ST76_9ZZZZ
MGDFITDVDSCLNSIYQKAKSTKQLKEDKTGMVIEINTTGKYSIYSFDLQSEGVTDLFPFFSKKPKLRQVSDYVIFCIRENDAKPFALIIELKSQMDPTAQLWATQQFVEFLIKRISVACHTEYKPETRKIGCLKTMPPKLRNKFRSGGTKPGKVIYNAQGIALLTEDKFVIADYLL